MISTEEYTGAVGYEHRKKFAQFFTPPQIARFMVGWVIGDSRGGEIHDPAFGLGAFLDQAPDECRFSGTEADPAILDFFRRNSLRKAVCVSLGDYLLDFGKCHDNIVCNPPYLRFQKFNNRDAVFANFRERLGVRLSGYTNIASAFLVKSLSELSSGGKLAYILPSEFLNAGYGTIVKDRLTRDCHLDSIIDVECEGEAFPEVITSVCIVLYDSSRRIEEVAFRKIASFDDICNVMRKPPLRSIPLSRLDAGEKWGKYFVAGNGEVRPSSQHLGSLSEYGRFSRGIATGANKFFVLSNTAIRKYGLLDGSYVPCITKSQQLRGLTFTDKDFGALAQSDKAVYLFSPGDVPDESSLRYIESGEKNGYNNGYITRHRSPWYKTESRTASPILMNVFSRSGYKVVRNYSSALTLTNFHCFYPNPWRTKYVDWLFLYLHSTVGRRLLSLSKRKYGNSLDKFEPNDLNDALAPTRKFFDSIGDDELQRLMDIVMAGGDPDHRLNVLFSTLLADDACGIDSGMCQSVMRRNMRERAEQLRLAI